MTEQLTQLQLDLQQTGDFMAPNATAELHRGHHHDTHRILDVHTIYMEPQVEEYQRGREILPYCGIRYSF